MSVKTPTFWYGENAAPSALRALALRPASWLYGVAFRIHQGTKRAQKVPIPVVCVGNLVAGGTGKTPSAVAILSQLRDKGLAKSPFFLLRGYGGAERGPLLVDPENHTAWDVGDEALILAQHAPTIVSADRVEGAKLGMQHGADMVVMDDGLQNPGIHKDLKIVVINGEMGFGNRKIMPAGPMREPLESGLEKADAFMLIGDDKTNALDVLPTDKPLIRAHLEADPTFKPDNAVPYLAFAGLGYPDKFFGFLRESLKLDLAKTVAFADHCPYDDQDLKTLHTQAEALGATLITTKKDYLRLPKIEGIDVTYVPVTLKIETMDALDNAFKIFEETTAS